MSPLRFTLRLHTGTVLRGVQIHGSGGPVAGPGGERRVRLAIERANKGLPFGAACSMVEPMRGHCRVEPTEEGIATEWIDLRGAAFVSVEEPGQ